MISTAPNWADKVICLKSGSTLLTFVHEYKSTVSPSFLERLPSYFTSIPVMKGWTGDTKYR